MKSDLMLIEIGINLKITYAYHYVRPLEVNGNGAFKG